MPPRFPQVIVRFKILVFVRPEMSPYTFSHIPYAFLLLIAPEAVIFLTTFKGHQCDTSTDSQLINVDSQ